MAEHGKVRVHRVEEPEVRNVRGREIGQALVLLAPPAGKLGALRRQDLENSIHDAAQIVAGVNLEERGNEAGVKPERAGLALFDVGYAQYRAALAAFILG